MESITVHELTAAYALDALDSAEARDYESHLATCAECRAELASLSEAAGALAFAVEAPAPPLELRERILDAAPVAACAAIGFGIWAGSLSRSLDHERSASSRANHALAILSDPAASRHPLSGEASGSLVVSPHGEAAIIVSRLRPAPSGKTYEAWVIANGMPVRAGTFQSGGDTSVLALGHAVPNGAKVAVTLEPKPGVDQPTGPIVIASQAV
jgi:anti-sigma-K factor RskA